MLRKNSFNLTSKIYAVNMWCWRLETRRKRMLSDCVCVNFCFREMKEREAETEKGKGIFVCKSMEKFVQQWKIFIIQGCVKNCDSASSYV